MAKLGKLRHCQRLNVFHLLRLNNEHEEIKKKKINNLEPTITEEMSQTITDQCDLAQGMVKSPQVPKTLSYPTMTITLSEDHITQITNSIQKSMNIQIVVAKVANSVLDGLRSRITDLEEENQQLKRRLQL